MSKYLKTIPRVLVVLPTVQKDCRDKFNGIMRYAQLNGPWDVQQMDDSPFIAKLGSFKNWYPDGIIRDTVKSLPSVVGNKKIPTVLLDPDLSLFPNCSSASHDSRQISETVADGFLRLGFKHFAYVGSVPQFSWSLEREDAFAERVRHFGYECAIYRSKSKKDWGLEKEYMQEWLMALPKPCGLMVAMDLRAKQVLDTCLAAGIRVPDIIAVISVDNDETICENTTPTLSSVLPDGERGGYLAAKLLDRLMRGLQRKTEHLTYGVKRIVHRQSSQYARAPSLLAASAVEFIRVNACAGIAVPDIAKALHVSRSILEKDFRRTMGHSVLEEIQIRRLERLCLLLRETSLSIGDIGERCGYPTETYLKRLFRKRFGTTMREYRKHPQMIEVPSSPFPVEPHLIGAESNVEQTTKIGDESTLAKRVLDIFAQGPCGKAKLAKRLGKAKPNRYLHGLVAKLLKEGHIEQTRPDKPNSRLQAYRLTTRSYM